VASIATSAASACPTRARVAADRHRSGRARTSASGSGRCVHGSSVSPRPGTPGRVEADYPSRSAGCACPDSEPDNRPQAALAAPDHPYSSTRCDQPATDLTLACRQNAFTVA